MSGKVWGTGLYFSGWVMICIFRYEVQTGIDRWPRDPEPYVAILFVAWSKSFLTQIFSIRPTSNLLDLCLVAILDAALSQATIRPHAAPTVPRGGCPSITSHFSLSSSRNGHVSLPGTNQAHWVSRTFAMPAPWPGEICAHIFSLWLL